MGKYKGFGGSGMNQNKKVSGMMQQAQAMQARMQQIQEEVEKKTVTATAGGGVVSVTMNGKKEVEEIVLKPEVVDPDDIETLQDLIMVAVNDAVKQADDMMTEGMSEITNGLNIPGLF